MKNQLLLAIASFGLSACASGPAADPAPREVILEWRTEDSFLVARPMYLVEAMQAPAVVLNVDTSWSHGHSSLLTPAATCPSTVIRLRADGAVERGYEMSTRQRRIPTLNARCFPIRPAER